MSSPLLLPAPGVLGLGPGPRGGKESSSLRVRALMSKHLLLKSASLRIRPLTLIRTPLFTKASTSLRICALTPKHLFLQRKAAVCASARWAPNTSFYKGQQQFAHPRADLKTPFFP